jgi:glucosyltransferase Lgt1/2/3
MRELNPNDKIHLIYDSQLLTEQARIDLRDFCTRLQINPINVSDIFSQCETEEEFNLIKVYENEINNLENGGNIAVCKDILIWLSPIYKLGLYSDMDKEVNTSQFVTSIDVKVPLLLPIGSEEKEENLYMIQVNNDVLAVVNSQDALPAIQKIQRNIFKACSPFKGNEESCFKEFFVPGKGSSMVNEDLQILHNLSKGKSAIEGRKSIVELCSNNKIFCQNFLSYSNDQDLNEFLELCVIKEKQLLLQEAEKLKEKKITHQQLIDYLRAGILPVESEEKNQLITHNETLLHNFTQKIDRIKEKIKWDTETFFNERREAFKEYLLIKITLWTSGPNNIRYSLFGSNYYRSKSKMLEEVFPYSFSYYRLDSLVKAITCGLGIEKTTSDFSWLPRGKTKMEADDNKINQAITQLQSFCRGFNAQQRFFNNVASSNTSGLLPDLIKSSPTGY